MADVWDDVFGAAAQAAPGRSGPSARFQEKARAISDRLGMRYDDFMAVMQFETGGTLDPAVRNQAGSSGTGLIQFMDKTARGLGTSTDALAKMSPEDQLDYVEKYLTPYKGKLSTLRDAYMAVLSPAHIGKDDSTPLFKVGTKAYAQNAGLDADRKGVVTVGDAVRKVARWLAPGVAEAAEKPVGSVWDEVFGPGPQHPAPRTPQATPTPSAPPGSTQTSQGDAPRLRPGEVPQITIDIEKPSTPQAAPPATLVPETLPRAPEAEARAALVPRTPYLPPGVPSIEEETLREDTTPWALLSGAGWGRAALAGGRGLANWLGVTNPLARRGLTAGVEALTSLAGRRTNVATGIEEPGTAGDVLSVAAPLGARALEGAVNPVLRRLPGAQGAEHELMRGQLQRQTMRMLPVEPSARQFQQVFRSNPPPVPTADIANTARDVLRRELAGSPGLRDPDVLRVTRGLMQTHRRRGGQVPMEQFWHDMNRVGAKVRELGWKRAGGNPEMSRLYAEMHDTLARMPNAGPELREAIAASRREHAVDQLRTLLGQGRGVQAVKGRTLSEVRGKRILDGFDRLIDDDRVFRETFQAGELGEIRELLTQANVLRDIPARGAAHNILSPRRSIPGALGGVIGGMVGGIPGAAIGATAGAGVHDTLTNIMLSPLGRQLLRAQLAGGARLTPQTLGAISAQIRKAQEGQTN